MMEEKTAQLRVKKGRIVMGYSAGTVFYATPTQARMLIDQGAVELIGGKVQGPTTVQSIGPQEQKKYSSAAMDGRSIDSRASAESGQSAQLFASEEAQASQNSNADTSQQSERRTGVASLLSTMDTAASRKLTSAISRITGGGSGTRTGKPSRNSRA